MGVPRGWGRKSAPEPGRVRRSRWHPQIKRGQCLGLSFVQPPAPTSLDEPNRKPAPTELQDLQGAASGGHMCLGGDKQVPGQCLRTGAEVKKKMPAAKSWVCVLLAV